MFLDSTFAKEHAVPMTASDWQRLGNEVKKRRERLGMSQPEVAEAGGPSVASQRLIENKLATSFRDRTFRQLEVALRWEEGSIDLLLAGEEPIETPRRSVETPVDSLVSPRRIVVLLPESTRDATDAEREEMEAAAKAAALRIYREQRQMRSERE